MRLTDPMLAAAAEALRDHPDHLRWLGYADHELARLRGVCGLPAPAGYSGGLPNYPPAGTARAQQIRSEVEKRMNGRFSPNDRIALESVLDELLADVPSGAPHA